MKNKSETIKENTNTVKFDWDRTTVEINYGLRERLKRERDEENSTYSKLIETMFKEHKIIKCLRDNTKPNASVSEDLVLILDYFARHINKIKNKKIQSIAKRWKRARRSLRL